MKSSPYNHKSLIPNNHPHTQQTNQFAELYATVKALDVVKELIDESHVISPVVLYTDSASLVHGVSDFIWKWEENGYRNARGSPVVDAYAFKVLHKRIQVWQRRGTEINFWKVPREYNTEADELASSALRAGRLIQEIRRIIHPRFFY